MKELSVHMTHDEYEAYKQFLQFIKDSNNEIFCLRLRVDNYNVFPSIQILSKNDAENIIITELKKEIKNLKDKLYQSRNDFK